jgi:hypothetical protein
VDLIPVPVVPVIVGPLLLKHTMLLALEGMLASCCPTCPPIVCLALGRRLQPGGTVCCAAEGHYRNKTPNADRAQNMHDAETTYVSARTICLSSGLAVTSRYVFCISPDFDGYQGTKNETLYPQLQQQQYCMIQNQHSLRNENCNVWAQAICFGSQYVSRRGEQRLFHGMFLY